MDSIAVKVVTTDKKRVSLYLDEDLKIALEVLAKARKRSLSNLIEVICQDEIKKAQESGEIRL